MSGPKPIIGMCGSIGAGKTQVAAEFARLGCLVIDSDRLNHSVLRRPEVVAALRGWWGERVVDAEGGADRRGIAEVIFSDAEQKRRLESLVYPLIAREREAMIEIGNEDPAVRAIILDSPLLFESNLDRVCQTIVFVEAGERQRLRRLQQERGWDVQELRRRERWQMSVAEKRARSDFVIVNEGSSEQLRQRVADVFQETLARHSSA